MAISVAGTPRFSRTRILGFLALIATCVVAFALGFAAVKSIFSDEDDNYCNAGQRWVQFHEVKVLEPEQEQKKQVPEAPPLGLDGQTAPHYNNWNPYGYRLLYVGTPDDPWAEEGKCGTRTPVLFVPGHQGSFRQISNMHWEFFEAEQAMRRKAANSTLLALFAMDNQEDSGAFHGSILHQQAFFLNQGIATLLHHCKSASAVIILGHSMGGVAARLAMTLPNHPPHSVSTLITLNTPHMSAPVFLDASIRTVYHQVSHMFRQPRIANADGVMDSTRSANPIDPDLIWISLVGGVRDRLIYSELGTIPNGALNLFQYTSAIPNVHMSVDHQCIMWCQQLIRVLVRSLYQSAQPVSGCLPDQSDFPASSDICVANKRMAILRAALIQPTSSRLGLTETATASSSSSSSAASSSSSSSSKFISSSHLASTSSSPSSTAPSSSSSSSSRSSSGLPSPDASSSDDQSHDVECPPIGDRFANTYINPQRNTPSLDLVQVRNASLLHVTRAVSSVYRIVGEHLSTPATLYVLSSIPSLRLSLCLARDQVTGCTRGRGVSIDLTNQLIRLPDYPLSYDQRRKVGFLPTMFPRPPTNSATHALRISLQDLVAKIQEAPPTDAILWGDLGQENGGKAAKASGLRLISISVELGFDRAGFFIVQLMPDCTPPGSLPDDDQDNILPDPVLMPPPSLGTVTSMRRKPIPSLSLQAFASPWLFAWLGAPLVSSDLVGQPMVAKLALPASGWLSRSVFSVRLQQTSVAEEAVSLSSNVDQLAGDPNPSSKTRKHAVSAPVLPAVYYSCPSTGDVGWKLVPGMTKQGDTYSFTIGFHSTCPGAEMAVILDPLADHHIAVYADLASSLAQGFRLFSSYFVSVTCFWALLGIMWQRQQSTVGHLHARASTLAETMMRNLHSVCVLVFVVPCVLSVWQWVLDICGIVTDCPSEPLCPPSPSTSMLVVIFLLGFVWSVLLDACGTVLMWCTCQIVRLGARCLPHRSRLAICSLCCVRLHKPHVEEPPVSVSSSSSDKHTHAHTHTHALSGGQPFYKSPSALVTMLLPCVQQVFTSSLILASFKPTSVSPSSSSTSSSSSSSSSSASSALSIPSSAASSSPSSSSPQSTASFLAVCLSICALQTRHAATVLLVLLYVMCLVFHPFFAVLLMMFYLATQLGLSVLHTGFSARSNLSIHQQSLLVLMASVVSFKGPSLVLMVKTARYYPWYTTDLLDINCLLCLPIVLHLFVASRFIIGTDIPRFRVLCIGACAFVALFARLYIYRVVYASAIFSLVCIAGLV